MSVRGNKPNRNQASILCAAEKNGGKKPERGSKEGGGCVPKIVAQHQKIRGRRPEGRLTIFKQVASKQPSETGKRPSTQSYGKKGGGCTQISDWDMSQKLITSRTSSVRRPRTKPWDKKKKLVRECRKKGWWDTVPEGKASGNEANPRTIFNKDLFIPTKKKTGEKEQKKEHNEEAAGEGPKKKTTKALTTKGGVENLSRIGPSRSREGATKDLG